MSAQKQEKSHPDDAAMVRIHLVGIGGSGMSTLARLIKSHHFSVSGSDREHDRGLRTSFYRSLESEGIFLYPQDGSGVTEDVSRVIISTAIETQIPDLEAARKKGIPVFHRSQELFRQLDGYRTIAIAGTSGKTTVTAMMFWVLSKLGYDPTFIGGAPVKNPIDSDDYIEFKSGSGNWAVFEADESDGSLIHYHPTVGLLNNLTKDHKPLDELETLFREFTQNIREQLVVNLDGFKNSSFLHSISEDYMTFGFSGCPDVHGKNWIADGWGSRFRLANTDIVVPIPGFHNAMNALAVCALCQSIGIDPASTAPHIRTFPGVFRRFEKLCDRSRITVIDDYAHNPDKIGHSLRTAHLFSRKVFAVFQPHGFGPTRFLFDDLVSAFCAELNAADTLILLPIFYAGGTVARDVSSDAMAEAVCRCHEDCRSLTRQEALTVLKSRARPGDLILVMGARDPSLRDFSLSIAELF